MGVMKVPRVDADPSLNRAPLCSMDVSMEDGSMEDEVCLDDVDQSRLRTEVVVDSTPVSHTEILRGAVDPSLHRALDSIMEDFLVEVRRSRLHLLRLAQRMDETYDRVPAVDWQDDNYYECYCCCHIHLHISTIRLDIVRKIDWCHPRFHWCWSGMTDGCLLHVLFNMR